jgi:acetyl-CoA synthetase (ADP-forming)
LAFGGLFVLYFGHFITIKYYVSLHSIDDLFNTNTNSPKTKKTPKTNKQFLNPKHHIHKHSRGRKLMNQTVKIINKAKKEGRKVLLENEAKTICTEYGISVTKFNLAKNEKEAASQADQIGYPVVLKIVSPDIIHKSEAGGVIVNLKTPAEVSIAYKKIIDNAKKYKSDAKIVGVLVQEMAPQSTEVIVGAIKDPQFGQTVMFGLGGIFVELLKDVNFRIAPINTEDAKEMITQLKAFPLLNGYRNTPPADIDALTTILCNVSRLVMENPEIKELDLNPVMAYPKGAKTVDARIILE